jgi:hypothetical protein
MPRLEEIGLSALLSATGEKLKSQLPEADEPLPTKLALLLDRLEAAEAAGKAVILQEEKVLRDRYLKVARH